MNLGTGMNLGTEPTNNESYQEASDDSFDELINSHRRQRYEVQKKPKEPSKIKVFVRLPKHKEIFNFLPEPTTSVEEVLNYFLEKNPSSLKNMYPKSKLKMLLANVHGKKKDFPGKALNMCMNNRSPGRDVEHRDGEPRVLSDHNERRGLSEELLQRGLDVRLESAPQGAPEEPAPLPGGVVSVLLIKRSFRVIRLRAPPPHKSPRFLAGARPAPSGPRSPARSSRRKSGCPRPTRRPKKT